MDEAGIWGIVAVLAFRLVYLAVILFTIVIVLLDNRNPVKTGWRSISSSDAIRAKNVSSARKVFRA